MVARGEQGPVSASAAAVSQLTMSKEQADKMFKNTPDFKDYPSWSKDVDAINEMVPHPPLTQAAILPYRGTSLIRNTPPP